MRNQKSKSFFYPCLFLLHKSAMEFRLTLIAFFYQRKGNSLNEVWRFYREVHIFTG
jgi:hypothetical protein